MVALAGHAWLLLGACVVAPRGACVVALGECMWFFWGVWFFLGRRAWFFVGGMCGFFQGGVHGFFWGGVHGFFQGGHVWFFPGGCAWFFPGGMRRIRRDTVNERAVRILLECFLVDTLLSGTRMSVGKAFSEAQLFLVVTSLLQKYTLSFPQDKPKPSTASEPGNFFRRPAPYSLIASPR